MDHLDINYSPDYFDYQQFRYKNLPIRQSFNSDGTNYSNDLIINVPLINIVKNTQIALAGITVGKTVVIKTQGQCTTSPCQ